MVLSVKQMLLLFSFLLFILSFGSYAYAESHDFQNDNANSLESLADKEAKKQAKLMEKFEKELLKMDLTVSDLNEVGDFYFEGDKLVLQVDSNNKDMKKLEKLQKIASDLKLESLGDVVSKDVSYSHEELVNLQDSFKNVAKELNLTQNYKLDLKSSENRLNLVIESLSNDQRESLINRFGDTLSITIDENFKDKYTVSNEYYKSRKEDFNSQGAGIGIKFRKTNGLSYECSTAGVAYKGTEKWVITAGHCGENIASPIYQWDSQLGNIHMNAINSDYDMMLINVYNSPITRYASNGLYNVSADSQTGYDATLSGSFTQVEGLRVCKVGITTNRTCGVVTTARSTTAFGDGSVTATVSGDGSVLSDGGDSGGAWFTQSLPYRLVGIHKGGNGLPGGSTVSYFTPWVEVANKYGLSLYTSSSKVEM